MRSAGNTTPAVATTPCPSDGEAKRPAPLQSPDTSSLKSGERDSIDAAYETVLSLTDKLAASEAKVSTLTDALALLLERIGPALDFRSVNDLRQLEEARARARQALSTLPPSQEEGE